MSPFDEARYSRLLEGLEAVEKLSSHVIGRERIDAESWRKPDLKLAKQLSGMKELASMIDIAHVSDGNHLSIAAEFDDESMGGVRYLRGQDISSEMMLDDHNPVFIPDYEYMKLKRSHIFKGDVLVTIVGANTGQTALVDMAPDKLTANCKLGILRPRASCIDPAYLHAFLSGRFGQSQISSAKRGGGQMGLILPDLRALKVPRFGKAFEAEVATLSLASHRLMRTVRQSWRNAENLLISALDLKSCIAPQALAYIRNSRDAFTAGRLDAEHFQPRYSALLDHIAATGRGVALGSLLAINKRGKQPEYVKSGLPVVNSKHVVNGEVRIDADNRRAHTDKRSLLIEQGDVLVNGTGIGTIGRAAPYLHEFKAIPDNHITILRPKKGVDPVYLSVFLNSLAGQFQVLQRLSGSSGQIELYPSDIAQFSVWNAPEATQNNIRKAVEKGFEQKQRAAQLLDAAKRAVEMAIEDSEAAAMAYLGGIAT